MIDRLWEALKYYNRKLLRAVAKIYDALRVQKVIDFLKGFFDDIPEFLSRFSFKRLFKYCWTRLRQCCGNPMGLPHNPGRRHMLKGASFAILALIAMGVPIPAWAAATVLCVHTGDNTDGSTWAKGFTSVTSALSGRAAGDIILVSNAHVLAVPDATISWTPPGGAIYVICATPSGASGNSGVATGAVEAIGTTNGTANFNINAAASAQWYVNGMTCATSSGSGVSNIYIFGQNTQIGSSFSAVNSKFKLLDTNTNTAIVLGSNAAKDCFLRFHNCEFTIASRAGFFFEQYTGQTDIIQSTLVTGATKPTPLVQGAGNGTLRFRECDLTGWNPSTGALYRADIPSGDVVFENCKLGSNYTGPFGTTGITLTSGTWLTGATSVTLINTDNANTTYSFAYADFLGTVGSINTIYANSGPQFSGAGIGWQIKTNAAAGTAKPFRTPFFNMWGTSTSAETPYVELIRDNATGLTDQDVWVEIDYVSAQGAAGPTGSQATSLNLNPITGAANTYATSSTTWTGTGGFSNPNKQTVILAATGVSGATITPAVANRVKARFVCAVASTTLYISPRLEGAT